LAINIFVQYLLNPDSAAAAATPFITAGASGLKTQARGLSLLSQVRIVRADLRQGHRPQIDAAAALHPGCIPNVDTQTIPVSVNIFDIAVPIVQDCIVHAGRNLTLKPDANLKAVSWRQ
jgi:hypothetical protein